jgi:hypothetical protein
MSSEIESFPGRPTVLAALGVYAERRMLAAALGSGRLHLTSSRS